MRKILKKTLKILLILLLSIIAFASLFMTAAYTLPYIVVDKKLVNEPETVTLYLLSNGAHTDVVVPAKNEVMDWTTVFTYKNTHSADSTYRYLAIGWGDKGFYIEIPTWDDLTPRIALRAGLGSSTSAIHATYYYRIYEGDDLCRKLTITQSQYQSLVKFVLSDLKTDAQNNVIHISTDAVYGDTDAFYEAKGSYSIFYTCNTWTNNLLKACGQRACLWTPFDMGILRLYPKY